MKAVYGWAAGATRAGIGFGMVLAALSTPAWAKPAFAPEIDPGSMASALTVLAGGMLIITGRKVRR
jgi:hypothetical protein